MGSLLSRYKRISILFFAGQTLLLLITAALQVTDHLSLTYKPDEHTVAIVLVALASLAVLNYLLHTQYLHRVARHESALLQGLAKAESTALAEHARLEAIVQQMPAGIILVDIHTREVLQANALANELLYLAPGQRIDIATLSGYQYTYTDGRPCALRHLPIFRAADGGEVIRDAEIELMTPAGVRRVLNINAAPIRDPEGQIIAVVCIFYDITAQQNAERMKDEFLAVLSHELLTPLTTILGWADFATVNRTPEFRDQALEVILRNGRRQHTLLDNMLDVSRLIHRRLPIFLEQTDLHAIATCSMAALAERAATHQVRLLLDDSDVPLPVQADSSRLQQAIGSLIENAIKFSPAQSTVTVRTWHADDWAHLSVTDNGRGIPAEELAAVFDPFRQLQRDEAQGGLGLGLTLVKGIVELHGGRVEAHSAGAGYGSTFNLCLPIALAPEAAPAPQQALVHS